MSLESFILRPRSSSALSLFFLLFNEENLKTFHGEVSLTSKKKQEGKINKRGACSSTEATASRERERLCTKKGKMQLARERKKIRLMFYLSEGRRQEARGAERTVQRNGNKKRHKKC
jgi:hypothetical protein